MKIKNIARTLFFRTYILLNEKKHKDLKYLLVEGKKSDTLIVSFSGFPGGGPARYNYISTLKNLNAHRLFILDDFGYKKRGSYYLGENGNWFIPEQISELIKKVQIKTNAQRIMTVGSSKGGTSALYYAIKCGAESCIIGAPQYRLGDYLNTDKHKAILEGIMGCVSDESVQKLNDVISDCISASCPTKPVVYIHYSPEEHTYLEHIADMITDLRKNGYSVVCDSEYNYTEHGDVAKHFPPYLLKVLSKKI